MLSRIINQWSLSQSPLPEQVIFTKLFFLKILCVQQLVSMLFNFRYKLLHNSPPVLVATTCVCISKRRKMVRRGELWRGGAVCWCLRQDAQKKRLGETRNKWELHLQRVRRCGRQHRIELDSKRAEPDCYVSHFMIQVYRCYASKIKTHIILYIMVKAVYNNRYL